MNNDLLKKNVVVCHATFHKYWSDIFVRMRSFRILIVLIGMLWLIDAIAFGGRYSTAVWQEASYQGQQFRYEVQYQFRKLGL